MSQPRIPRRLHREIEQIVEGVTSDYSIELTRKHVAVILRRKGRSRKVTVSLSASDRRAMLNFRADVRRAYETLKNERIAA